jgi:error-prone DNA polymerase
MQNTDYAELFCQSNFSFLQGASHPQELVKQADFLGYKYLAITDECSVAGIVRAHSAIKQQNLRVKLIVGSVFHIEGSLTLVVLCPSRAAYAELCRIITNSRKRAKKGAYQLDSWDVKSLKHCLLIWLPTGNITDDKDWALSLKKYHADRLWIGQQRHLIANEHRHINYLQRLQQTHDIPITACGGVLMHIPQRLPLQHTLQAIKHGQTITSLGRTLSQNSERYLRPGYKLSTLYANQYLAESMQIAKLCHFNLDDLRYEYPSELVPKNKTPSQYLRELVLRGMEIRFGTKKPIPFNIKRTIVKELHLISLLGYEYFFLTIYDIVKFAQKQNILYQGRGSAANSIVCYCLEITAVDPRQISVLFERFISKERKEEPDIDVDFEHERREEVIQYIYQKYGRERTAIAATVTTYRLKSALRDVGKALGVSEQQLDFFIKNINHRDKDLGWQGQISELGFSQGSLSSQHFTALVDEIRGFPRHLSQHVGGFIISQGPLYQLVPIENAAMPERSVIQWDKDDLEALGLLKVDVLALGMLTAIRKSLDIIRHTYGHVFKLADITAMGDDEQVYEMIQRADTVGVFQIESRAQMSMLPRLKPKTFYDLVVQIAIVRPGPIQGGMVHPYLKHRAQPNLIHYPSEALRSVLERTSGVPIFQEQVIKLAMVAAGFSGGEADQLRRAMASWKKTGELKQFKEKLISGMLARGYPEEYAQRIYQQICGFGEYGFPESHSASFAVLAYVSSWLKYYYPAAFYIGLLNSLPMGFYSASQLIQDAKRHQVIVLPVCINHSECQHTIEYHQQNWAIRLGLRIIKSLNNQDSKRVVSARPTSGFKNIEQVKALGLSKASLTALASADAFHLLSKNRYTSRWQLMNNDNELPLFSQLSDKNHTSDSLRHIPAPTQVQTLLEDYQATNLSLFTHPIALLRQANLLPNTTLAVDLIDHAHNSLVKVVGIATGRQRPGTSKGVTFITLEDDTGNINVIVWLATSRAQKQAYLKSTILMVKGHLEKGDGGVTHVIAGKLTDMSHLLEKLNAKSRNFH